MDQALEYMERELPPDAECSRCVLRCRSLFAQFQARYDDAYAISLLSLQRAKETGDEEFQASALAELCYVSGMRRDYALAGKWAQEGEEYARRTGHQQVLAYFLFWQAVAVRHAGDERKACRLFRRATSQMSRVGALPCEGQFDARCRFHELGGDTEQV
jgi:hypothetical protein